MTVSMSTVFIKLLFILSRLMRTRTFQQQIDGCFETAHSRAHINHTSSRNYPLFLYKLN